MQLVLQVPDSCTDFHDRKNLRAQHPRALVAHLQARGPKPVQSDAGAAEVSGLRFTGTGIAFGVPTVRCVRQRTQAATRWPGQEH